MQRVGRQVFLLYKAVCLPITVWPAPNKCLCEIEIRPSVHLNSWNERRRPVGKRWQEIRTLGIELDLGPSKNNHAHILLAVPVALVRGCQLPLDAVRCTLHHKARCIRELRRPTEVYKCVLCCCCCCCCLRTCIIVCMLSSHAPSVNEVHASQRPYIAPCAS